MVLKRDEVATKGERVSRMQVTVPECGPGGCTWSMHVLESSCSSLKTSCEDLLYKKATLLFPSISSRRPLCSLCSCEDWQKVLFFLHHRALCNTHAGLRGRQTDCFGLTAGSNNWKHLAFVASLLLFLHKPRWWRWESNFPLLTLLNTDLQLAASLLAWSRTGQYWKSYKYLFDVKWGKKKKNQIS